MFFLLPKVAVILFAVGGAVAAFRRWRGVPRRPGSSWAPRRRR